MMFLPMNHFGLPLIPNALQGLMMVGLKEFVLHNSLGYDDVHFHFSGVSEKDSFS